MEGIGRYFEKFKAIAGNSALTRERIAQILTKEGIPCAQSDVSVNRGVASVKLPAAARSEFTLSHARILKEVKEAGLKVSEIRATR